MELRNGEHGYGVVTKTLHWVTVGLLAAQFTVGYLVDTDGSGRGRGRGRGGDDGEGGGRGRGRGGEDDITPFDGELTLLDAHVALGLAVLLVACLRVWWRATTPLPPWDPRLGAVGRRWLSRVERALLVLLFVLPATGLVLVLGDDDLLALHVAAHLAFFVLLAAHVGIVLRGRLLRRMLGTKSPGP